MSPRREREPIAPKDATLGDAFREIGKRQTYRQTVIEQIHEQQLQEARVIHHQAAGQALEHPDPRLYDMLTQVANKVRKNEPISDVLAAYPEFSDVPLSELFGPSGAIPLLPERTPHATESKKKKGRKFDGRKQKHHPVHPDENAHSVEEKRMELFTKYRSVADLFGRENVWRRIDGQRYIPSLALQELLERSDGKPSTRGATYQAYYKYWKEWSSALKPRTLRGKDWGQPLLISETDALQFLWFLDASLGTSKSRYSILSESRGDGRVPGTRDVKKKS